jgi:hypothetical protein
MIATRVGLMRTVVCASPRLLAEQGEKPGRPQFVRIAKLLRLSTGQRHQPGFGFARDRRPPAGTQAIIECCHRAFDHGALGAALDRLMVQPERPADRKKRRVFSVGQQYSCPLDPARRLGSRLRYRSQFRRILIYERQFNRSPPRCHDFTPLHCRLTEQI